MLGTPGEPVEVWLTDGRPGRFFYRGRMYTVMLVLGHEPSRRGDPSRAAGSSDDPSRDDRSRDDRSRDDRSGDDRSGDDRSGDDRGRDDRSRGGGGYLDRADRECWRVEATPLRALPPATYELCRDIGTDRWSLLRA
jgi:hypothetical protein